MRLLPTLLLFVVLLPAQSLAGLWVGSAQRGAFLTPVQLQITQTDNRVTAVFVNGKQHSPEYTGTVDGSSLRLQFPDYANALIATVQDGILTGTFAGYARPELLRLRRVPDIAGDWRIAVHGPKGETEWKLQVQQEGIRVQAVVLRIDGDTGMLYGRFDDGVFTLSRFTADGPDTLTLSLLPDGRLQAGRHLAHRASGDEEAELPAVDNPTRHTWMKHPDQPLHFRFPDLYGHVVSSAEPRFQGKVLLVTVGGSWCPNCHDEAPLLESLYRKYHARGLDVVDLDFEEAAQLAKPMRLRAFVREYGLTYPVLLAGTPGQLDQRLPGVADLNCWPTLFFIGRDGLVQRIHAGFAGPATGAAHTRLVAETNAFVQKLLAANR
ncbi:MAG: TlpA family protein disulfide reductase [Terriglobales bacterium]